MPVLEFSQFEIRNWNFTFRDKIGFHLHSLRVTFFLSETDQYLLGMLFHKRHIQSGPAANAKYSEEVRLSFISYIESSFH